MPAVLGNDARIFPGAIIDNLANSFNIIPIASYDFSGIHGL
jgi:hypothetical protein